MKKIRSTYKKLLQAFEKDNPPDNNMCAFEVTQRFQEWIMINKLNAHQSKNGRYWVWNSTSFLSCVSVRLEIWWDQMFGKPDITISESLFL